MSVNRTENARKCRSERQTTSLFIIRSVAHPTAHRTPQPNEEKKPDRRCSCVVVSLKTSSKLVFLFVSCVVVVVVIVFIVVGGVLIVDAVFCAHSRFSVWKL